MLRQRYQIQSTAQENQSAFHVFLAICVHSTCHTAKRKSKKFAGKRTISWILWMNPDIGQDLEEGSRDIKLLLARRGASVTREQSMSGNIEIDR